MKKVVLIFLLLFFIIQKNVAQPNQGFETWTSSFNYEVPTDWQTLNMLYFVAPPTPLSVTKAVGIDVHSGNYALKLQTVEVSNNPLPEIINDTMGVMFTGLVNLSPVYYKYGYPCACRPAQLNFWYKYLPVGIDTGEVKIILKKAIGGVSYTIGYGSASLYQTLTYTQMITDIDYFSNEIPDSCVITFASSKGKASARPGSTLFLDDIEFSGWVGIAEPEKSEEEVKVYPNPAKENITFELKIAAAKSIRINDITGKNIAIFSINNSSVNINTSTYQQGIYLYEIEDKNDALLTKGKFNVVK